MLYKLLFFLNATFLNANLSKLLKLTQTRKLAEPMDAPYLYTYQVSFWYLSPNKKLLFGNRYAIEVIY